MLVDVVPGYTRPRPRRAGRLGPRQLEGWPLGLEALGSTGILPRVRLSALRPRRVPASATRRCVRSGRATAVGRSDAGLSLVEAIIAIAIVAVAVAATAAALSAASKSRDAAKERSLAAEIANEVLAKAEAFGCGLPPDFDGVGVTDRVGRCRQLHGNSTDVSLADMDYEVPRDGRDFEVQIRMRWFAPGIDTDWAANATYSAASEHDCNKRADWASGWDDPDSSNATRAQDQAQARQPTILARTVTVTPVGASQRQIKITSHETVEPPIDDPTATEPYTAGIMIGPTTATPNDARAVTLQDASSSPTWTYKLEPDSNRCVWFPFLKRSDHYMSRTGVSGSTTVSLTSLCSLTPQPTSAICYTYQEL